LPGGKVQFRKKLEFQDSGGFKDVPSGESAQILYGTYRLRLCRRKGTGESGSFRAKFPDAN